MKESETNAATPEQLLQILEAQLAAHRLQRAQSNRNRATILVAGILLIVVSASAALLVLNEMLVDFRGNHAPPPSAAAGINAKN